jgi:hypothetical protein
MSRPFFGHLAFMALGYALAVLVATTIACILFGLPTVLPDDGRWGSFHQYLRDFPAMFMIGGMFTALLALLIAGRFQGLFPEISLNLSCLAGGFFGGLAYWAMAGKHSGLWKERA